MTHISKRLSHLFVVLIGVSAASIAGAAAPALTKGNEPAVFHIKPHCGQHPWDVTCVCENPEEQFIAPATCKFLGLAPRKPDMLARLFQ